MLGARGRMGSEVVNAVYDAPDLELVANLDMGDDLEDLLAAGTQVAVDFTHPESVMGNVEFLITHGIHPVVGTTGPSARRHPAPSGPPVDGAQADAAVWACWPLRACCW